MSLTGELTAFWRVGRRADPLHASARYQGKGRFDDPERLVGVLYGAIDLRTCLLELLRAWPEAPAAAAVLGRIPPAVEPEDDVDAKSDAAIGAASKRRPVPPWIFQRDGIYVRAVSAPLQLLELRDVTTLERLGADQDVAREMVCCGYLQFDRGTLLAPVQHRRVTQAVTGAVLRGSFVSERFDGMTADGRHGGDVYLIFQGPGYDPAIEEFAGMRQVFAADNAELRKVADMLGPEMP